MADEKRIVNTKSADDLKLEINQLLVALHDAKNGNEKKKIRRALRTRDFYLSKQPKVEALTPAPVKVEPPKTKAKAKATIKGK